MEEMIRYPHVYDADGVCRHCGLTARAVAGSKWNQDCTMHPFMRKQFAKQHQDCWEYKHEPGDKPAQLRDLVTPTR